MTHCRTNTGSGRSTSLSGSGRRSTILRVRIQRSLSAGGLDIQSSNHAQNLQSTQTQFIVISVVVVIVIVQALAICYCLVLLQQRCLSVCLSVSPSVRLSPYEKIPWMNHGFWVWFRHG